MGDGISVRADAHRAERRPPDPLPEAPRLDLSLFGRSQRDVFRGFLAGGVDASTRKRGKRERQVARKSGTIAVFLAISGCSRFCGAAAEIFAVVRHAHLFSVTIWRFREIARRFAAIPHRSGVKRGEQPIATERGCPDATERPLSGCARWITTAVIPVQADHTNESSEKRRSKARGRT